MTVHATDPTPWRGRVGGWPLGVGEVVALQDIVGQRIPEHDGADFVDAAYGQLPQVPVAPAGMDAFAERARLVLSLTRFAAHPRSPSQHPCAVAAPGQIGISAALGLCWWTVDLDPFAMRPLDVLGAAKPTIDEMAARKAAQQGAQSFQHRPHQAAIRAIVADLDSGHN